MRPTHHRHPERPAMPALRRSRFSPSARRQAGQAMLEYAVIVSVVTVVMFTPMPDLGVPEFVGKTPSEVLAQALRNLFRGFSFLTSVL